MTDLLESLTKNLSISDIIAALSMIGAIVAAISAWFSKRKAKRYARNADIANQAARRYYSEMCVHLERQNEQNDQIEYNREVLVAMAEDRYFSAKEISASIDMSVATVEYRLNELKVDNKVTSRETQNGLEWKRIGVETAGDKLQKIIDGTHTNIIDRLWKR